jgi:hypothetical protein
MTAYMENLYSNISEREKEKKSVALCWAWLSPLNNIQFCPTSSPSPIFFQTCQFSSNYLVDVFDFGSLTQVYGSLNCQLREGHFQCFMSTKFKFTQWRGKKHGTLAPLYYIPYQFMLCSLAHPISFSARSLSPAFNEQLEWTHSYVPRTFQLFSKLFV